MIFKTIKSILKSSIFISILLLCHIAIPAQKKSGIFLSGGKPILRDMKFGKDSWFKDESKLSSIISVSIGYRLRIHEQQSKGFFDFELAAGFTSINFDSRHLSVFPPYNTHISASLFSIEGSYNYKIFKKLSAGIGIVPTIYLNEIEWYSLNESNYDTKFDSPLKAKIAYNFKVLELELYYKQGFTNSFHSRSFSSGKRNEWGLSLFFPFGKK